MKAVPTTHARPRPLEIRHVVSPVVATTPPRVERSRVVFIVASTLVGLNAVLALSFGGDRPVSLRAGWGLSTILAVAAAILAFDRGGRSIRATLAIAVGVGAVICGAALTLPHVFKVGLTPADVLGIASSAAGLTLLGLGTMIVLRGSGVVRKVIAVPVTLSVAYYLVAPLALAVYATHPPRADAPARTPAVAGIAYRDVGVPTSDGVRLSGWFIPSTNGAAVLVLHGSGSSRAAVLPHVLELAERGYGVLAIDARGHGRSGGRPMEFGWHGEADVAAAVSFLLRQPGVDASRIGVLGMSMGGEQALTAAAADPRIAAVVAEGATMRAFADVASIPAPAVSRWLSAPHYWLQFAAADLMTSARQPIGLDEAVGRIAPRPVLLIAGGEGSEIAFSETYAAVAPASTYVWAVPDTPHVQALQRHPVEWRAQVLGFFDGALTG